MLEKHLNVVSLLFHANYICRCIYGSFKEGHKYENHSLSTEQVSRAGAYSTNATVELRNMRNTLWSEQFRNVEVGSNVVGKLHSC